MHRPGRPALATVCEPNARAFPILTGDRLRLKELPMPDRNVDIFGEAIRGC